MFIRHVFFWKVSDDTSVMFVLFLKQCSFKIVKSNKNLASS